MTRLDVHVSVTFNASPVLIDAIMDLADIIQGHPIGISDRPQIKPENAPDEEKSTTRMVEEPEILQEIEPFDGIEEMIGIPDQSPHLKYAETADGRLYIQYLTGKIYTTWDEVLKADQHYRLGKKTILAQRAKGNRGTAWNQFQIAVRNGLRPGHPEDPDEPFKPILNRSSALRGDFGQGVEE